ncbi:DUF481 domain-containing protein [Parvularcula sp. ZS-1/3]|uniref:DUF481 domain-containing protein n=1 Tax=Parvularcula mediterranea TaxID=2732508 RepID=A0A7Y3RN85_9PROT|nr:DUF481 domain-containing protein [Parvularcula mediterranea]NNU17203.1 DUF481 domain-containing protein [Parvularcula mediterranea]
MLSTAPLILASTLIALADLKKGEDGWDGQVVFNASAASGNTENAVIGARFDAARKFGPITHAFEAAGDYAEATQRRDGTETSVVTQNRWHGQYRIEIQTGDNSFLYGRGRYGEDQFSGFDRQAFVGGGLGHSLYDRPNRRLTLLVGPGYQYLERTRPQNAPDDFERTEGTLAVFLGETLRHVIRENVTLEQSLDATISDENAQINNTISLKTKLTEKISSRISYRVIHNTDPPDGRQSTDTLLQASIGYDF